MTENSWSRKLKAHFGGGKNSSKLKATASNSVSVATQSQTASKKTNVNEASATDIIRKTEEINLGGKTSESETSIRLLSLHPGKGNESIIISLNHGTILDLPTCDALSYQWGAPKGTYPILCQNSNVELTKLLVTPNLLAALKRLRLPKQSRRLWIDALCINQEDIAERSQQVPLMRHIYANANRVVMWIGEQTALTHDVFRVLNELSVDLFALESQGEGEAFFAGLGSCTTFPKPARERELVALRRSAVWPHLLSVVNEREYFLRLWIMQEVVLAKRAVVTCGAQEVDWDVFVRAASFIVAYKPFTEGLKEVDVLKRIVHIRTTQWQFRNRPDEGLGLGSLLISFSSSQVTDPLDRVFGILGLVNLPKQTERLKPDYSKTPEQVFCTAAGLAITHEQSLIPWLFILAEPSVRKGIGMPSWAPYLDGSGSSFTLPVQEWFLSLLTCPHKIVIGDVLITGAVIPSDEAIDDIRIQLTVWGFVLDTITSASVPFSPETINPLSFHYIDHLSTSSAYPTYAHASTALWHTLSIYNLADPNDVASEDKWKAHFLAFANTLDCAVLGLTPSIYARNPSLRSFASTSPALQARFPAEIQENISVRMLVARHNFLRKGFEHARDFGDGSAFRERMCEKMCSTERGLGRNVFVGRKGWMGVGPGGANGENGTGVGAVRVGDVIAIIHRALTPVILRKCSSDLYVLVGPAYVACLKDAREFTPDGFPGLERIRIV